MKHYVEIDSIRVYAVGSALGEIGIDGAKFFESIDPQMTAVKDLVSKCSDKAIPLVFVNSLVSYMLTMRGEDFWYTASRFFSEKCNSIESVDSVVEIVKEFTLRYNRYMVDQKIKRIDRISKCKHILEKLTLSRVDYIWEAISRCLSVDPNSKTVVFALKMLYYSFKAMNMDYILPYNIPIPIDRRVARITYTSGIAVCKTSECNYTDLLSHREKLISAWNSVAKISKIPPLHLDAVIWYFGGFEEMKNREELLNKIDIRILNYFGVEIVKKLINELFYKL